MKYVYMLSNTYFIIIAKNCWRFSENMKDFLIIVGEIIVFYMYEEEMFLVMAL